MKTDEKVEELSEKLSQTLTRQEQSSARKYLDIIVNGNKYVECNKDENESIGTRRNGEVLKKKSAQGNLRMRRNL